MASSLAEKPGVAAQHDFDLGQSPLGGRAAPARTTRRGGAGWSTRCSRGPTSTGASSSRPMTASASSRSTPRRRWRRACRGRRPHPRRRRRPGPRWDIRQRHAHPDPALANAHILEDLERGVTSIQLASMRRGGRPPARLWTASSSIWRRSGSQAGERFRARPIRLLQPAGASVASTRTPWPTSTPIPWVPRSRVRARSGGRTRHARRPGARGRRYVARGHGAARGRATLPRRRRQRGAGAGLVVATGIGYLRALGDGGLPAPTPPARSTSPSPSTPTSSSASPSCARCAGCGAGCWRWRARARRWPACACTPRPRRGC